MPALARPSLKEVVDSDSRLRLAGELQRRLSGCAYPSLHHLRASLRDGRVTLRGTVSSFFLKQVAQEIAMRAVANLMVQNEIEVDDRAAPQARSATPMDGPLKRGDRARVMHGALAGVEGLVVKCYSKCRVVVAVALNQHGVSIEIDDYLLERI